MRAEVPSLLNELRTVHEHQPAELLLVGPVSSGDLSVVPLVGVVVPPLPL